MDDIVTLEKSWFCSIADHILILLPPGGKVSDLERVIVQSTK
jgi:hypothetical protein